MVKKIRTQYINPISEDTKRKLQDPEWLNYQYNILQKSSLKIAKDLDISDTTVLRYIHKNKVAEKNDSVRNQYVNVIPEEILDKLNDSKWLDYQHNFLYKTLQDISLELGVSDVTVRKYFRKNKIFIRPPGEQLAFKQLGKEAYLKTRDKDWLYDEYIVKGKTMKQISKDLNITYSDVHRAIQRCNIKAKFPGKEIRLDTREKLNSREWMYEQYVLKRRDYMDIAEEISVANTTIMKYLQIHKISARTISEAQSGEYSSNWKGGISFEPYCTKFTKQFKEGIRDKFNRKCYLCGSTESKIKHSVHHIDYNKNSICNGRSWSFVILCQSCHGKTNYNRWYYFNLLINYWATKYIGDLLCCPL